MDLWKAQEMVLTSDSEHWEIWGESYSDSDADTHGWHATFRADVALVLWWGQVENDEFEEAWTKGFPEPRARAFAVEATYAGSTVLEDVLVDVDGGRYMVPLPRPHQAERDGPIQWQVGGQGLAVARLIHDLAGWQGHEFETALALGGLVVID
ncbi:MAG TPA: hypothetical protein VFC03_09945 [Acidimicrobiales bacterium]|nr:hypothetical protein [Acidimicrobiales bacterium]